MSRPDIPAGVQSAVTADHVQWLPLVIMEFASGTIYLAGTDFDVDYGGHTYIAARGMGSMEPIVETPDDIAGIKFTLSGVPSAALTEALTEVYQGRKVTVMWGFLSASGTLTVDPAAWIGRLDIPEIVRGAGTRTITVTAEHRMADWKRPRQLLFNHADQQRIDPGDTFFLGIESMSERTIVVFSKEAMMQ